MIDRKPDNFVAENFERTMVTRKTQSAGSLGNILSKESLKNNGNIKNFEVVRKNVQFCLPSTVSTTNSYHVHVQP